MSVPFTFNIPYRNNPKLKAVMEKIRADKKLQMYWKCANVMAIERMGYTDHGPTHVKIVSNLALKLLRILVEKNHITSSIVENYASYGMKTEDAEVVVVLGSIFHDLGMIVQRNNHEKYSATLALEFLERCLNPLH
jgi:metal-dependent HD superfamily phosphatase/phosphodiesterase